MSTISQIFELSRFHWRPCLSSDNFLPISIRRESSTILSIPSTLFVMCRIYLLMMTLHSSIAVVFPRECGEIPLHLFTCWVLIRNRRTGNSISLKAEINSKISVEFIFQVYKFASLSCVRYSSDSNLTVY